MDATRNDKLSWEKQEVWDAAGGIRFTVEYGVYGEMVSRVDYPGGFWHCSNGVKSIPDEIAFLR